jgi:hypothetical protein
MIASLNRGADKQHRRPPSPLNTDRSVAATTAYGSLVSAAPAATPTSAGRNGTRPWPLEPTARRDRTRPRRSAPATAGREPRLVTDRCVAHIDALYLLAYLYIGEQTMAEAAVVNAVADTAADPAITVAGPPQVWHILTSHVHPNTDSPGHLRRQREAVALIAAGRTPAATGALLGITSTQVDRDVWTAIPAIRAHLGLQSPRRPPFLAAPAGQPVPTGGLRLVADTEQDGPSPPVSNRVKPDTERRIGRSPGRSRTSSRLGKGPRELRRPGLERGPR